MSVNSHAAANERDVVLPDTLANTDDYLRGQFLFLFEESERRSTVCTFRSDFYREVRTLSRLRDENVVQLIGVCTSPGFGFSHSVSIVSEYMKHADLKNYLQHHNAVWLNAASAHIRTLRLAFE